MIWPSYITFVAAPPLTAFARLVRLQLVHCWYLYYYVCHCAFLSTSSINACTCGCVLVPLTDSTAGVIMLHLCSFCNLCNHGIWQSRRFSHLFLPLYSFAAVVIALCLHVSSVHLFQYLRMVRWTIVACDGFLRQCIPGVPGLPIYRTSERFPTATPQSV